MGASKSSEGASLKLIKPLRLSIMPRIFEHGAQPHLVVTAFAYFPLDAPEVLLGEQAMWQDFALEAKPLSGTLERPPSVAGAILDEGLPKARAEILVRGNAYPPGGPAPGCAVRLVVGAAEAPIIDKKLHVTGERYWDFMGMSMPAPFEVMPLDWEHAFGGPDFAANPLGKGILPVVRPDGTSVQPLPNVEAPDQRIKSKGDRPKPASFGPLDPTHPSRLSRYGTFDKKWLETEYPGMPSDMHLEAHNCAPEDQRVDAYFAGGEPFVLEHMHRTRPKIEGKLPTLKARAFFRKRGEADDVLHEVGMRLETVQFFPHIERGILVFRGVAEITEDDGHDVAVLMVGGERVGEPRSLDHYREVMRTRLDREEGAIAALRDADLLPPIPRWSGDATPNDEFQKLLEREGLAERNLERRAALNHERMKQEFSAAGLDPAAFGMPAEPPKFPKIATSANLDEVAAVMQEAEDRDRQTEERAAKHRADTETRGRALCEKHGISYDEFMATPTGGPPTFRAAVELAKVRAAVGRAHEAGVELPELRERAADPEFERQLVAQEHQLKELYRDGAQMMPPARVLDVDEARMRGQRIAAAHASSTPMADEDLTGADLEGAQLPGADLSLAFLEMARLDRASLPGADLHRAVLARASLRDADLKGANLAGANLGEADLTGADLSGADLSGAVLFRAKLDRTRLDGAKLRNTEIWETQFRDVRLVGAELRDVTFMQSTVERLVATDAVLENVTFLECKAPGLDLSGARANQLHFVSVDAPGFSLRGATVTKLSVLADSSMPGADFSSATIPGAALRGCNLERANFEAAVLDGSDLSECNLRGANFDRSVTTGSMMIRADLTDATFRKAKLLDVTAHKVKLGGTDFGGSNLFQADLAGAKGDNQTSFSGANLGRVRQTRKS